MSASLPRGLLLLARCEENSRQHQRVTNEVKQLQLLAQKQNRHRGAENRCEMQERRDPVGADEGEMLLLKNR